MITDLEDLIRNSPAKAVRAISGPIDGNPDIENCEWIDLVYIGDDPNKDFVNLNPLGVKTIRVNTGRFKNQKAKDGYDANIKINDLSQLHIVLGI